MDNRSVSFSIKPTKDAGEVEALYDASWSLLMATVRRNAKHASAKEILDEYLDEAQDDGHGFSDDKHVEFSFRSPASACDVQMEVAAHWFELAIALAAKELGELCRAHGYELKPPRATAKEMAAAVRKLPFVANADSIVGIKRGAKPRVLVDGGGDFPLDEADLTAVARKLAQAAAASGKCACVFCGNVRAGKAVVVTPKPSKEAPKKAPPTPAAPTEKASLEPFTNLQKALKSPDRCGSLDLKGKIDKLPNDLGKLKRMTALDVSENLIPKLPASLFTLTALESLNLAGNSFAELPPDIGNLTALKTLNLDRTDLTKLPDRLQELSSLEELTLAESSLTRVSPSLLRLTRLRRLSLFHLHQLGAPLPNLGELKELESLMLGRLHRPKGVLDGVDFSQLKKLVELDLSWVNAPRLPKTLRDLPRLSKLAIERNDFTELPDTFATLTGLTELKAMGTKFPAWPRVLNDLPQLKTVDFRISRIANLDDLRSLPALEWLSLEGTPLTRLPQRAPDLPALKELVLEDTKLTKLPLWLATLPALETLRINNAPIADGEREALKRKRRSLRIVG